MPFEPESNILLFRYGDDDALMVAIRDALVRRGEAHITSTEFAGKRWLRMTIMNALTREEDCRDVLDLIEASAARLRG